MLEIIILFLSKVTYSREYWHELHSKNEQICNSDKLLETHADCTQSVLMDFANKNCENCTQDIYEKAFSDLGSGYRNCFIDSR